FSYNGQPILERQDLEIREGDFIGISGPSGKGKTTLLNLLLGFLEPDSGEICINEIPAGMSDRRRYWERISYVKQQSFLLHDTLLHNITLNGKAADPGRLSNVVETAGLSALVESSPEKWEKVIAENGKNISGGQRQRIAIARALYKAADLIILDEPFNELDNASEIKLLKSLQQLASEGKLIILITHSRDSLSYCNKIISLDE
ncbi:MAG TPA: ATP-binding cassette domain-containing protein, partial [Puia sp.]|nr:ATP-binding cassette domain-containing protein [Puia sp.]